MSGSAASPAAGPSESFAEDERDEDAVAARKRLEACDEQIGGAVQVALAACLELAGGEASREVFTVLLRETAEATRQLADACAAAARKKLKAQANAFQMKMATQRTASSVQLQTTTLAMEASYNEKIKEKVRELVSGDHSALFERIDELEEEVQKIIPLEERVQEMACRARAAEREREDARGQRAAVEAQVAEATATVRRVMAELELSSNEQLSLKERIEELVEAYEAGCALRTHLHGRPSLPAFKLGDPLLELPLPDRGCRPALTTYELTPYSSHLDLSHPRATAPRVGPITARARTLRFHFTGSARLPSRGAACAVWRTTCRWHTRAQPPHARRSKSRASSATRRRRRVRRRRTGRSPRRRRR